MKKRTTLDQQKIQAENKGKEAWTALLADQYAKAEALYIVALALAEKIEDAHLISVFNTYLGVSRRGQNKLAAAALSFLSAADTAHTRGYFDIEAHARLMLVEQTHDLGEIDKAIEQALRALDAAYKCNDLEAKELCLGHLGRLHLEKGFPEQALEFFTHALSISTSVRAEAICFGNLGLTMVELGQLEEALSFHDRALDRAEASGDLQLRSICHGSIGNIYFEQGKFDRAIAFYQEALKCANLADDQRRASIWLGNLGNTYLKLGDFEAAVRSCDQALIIARVLHDQHAEAAHLDSLGDCLLAEGQSEKAKEKYDQALAISREIADRQGERIYLFNIGRAHRALGQLQPAFNFFRRAIDLFDQQRSSIKADELKSGFAGRGQDLYRDMVQVCLSLGKRVDALEYIGRAKSRALLDLLSNSPIDISEITAGEDAALAKLILREGELRAQISHFERLFWQSSVDSDGHRGAVMNGEQTQEIYREWRHVINQLKRCHPNYANLVAANAITFDEMKSLWHSTADGAKTESRMLSKDTAIFEFYWTDEYLISAGIWHGLSHPEINVIDSPSVLASFEQDLGSFLEMASTEGWEVPKSLCVRLGNTLLRPLLSSLPAGVKKLLIVPHGSLYHLPFAALHTGEHFVCEKYAISYLPTISLIPALSGMSQAGARRADGTGQAETSGQTQPTAPARTTRQAGAARQAKATERAGTAPDYLVSAISDYSRARETGVVFNARLRSAAGLEDLTYALDEANTIYSIGSKRGGKAKLLTNHQVKDELFQHFKQYPIVHFAGHAVFNAEEPLASGLVLSDGSMLTAASILQGNSLRTNCGQLLVLSACRTGTNIVTKGGEIMGLARALMYAGMPNLVLSLWEVADRSTAQLMKDFHESIITNYEKKAGLAVASSLQAAQIAAIKEGQALHAWAPFIHLGID